MSNAPSVSVVISAYCDEQGLRSTVESIYQQLDEESNAGLLFELIIVDDGAEQAVKTALLQLQSQHADIVVINQDNAGLTRALMTACAVAKHEYIARIDVGDRMLRTRLRQQIDYLQANDQAVAVATWANIVTAEAYPLYQVQQTSQEILQSLQPKALNLRLAADFSSPQHYTMMFRKHIYSVVGGYRAEFYFAQDFDLWLRMSEHGLIHIIEESLNDSVFSANSLSGANNRAQQQLSQLAWQSALLRRQGNSDQDALKKALLIRPKPLSVINRTTQTKSLYFIAKCLLDQGHFGARQYFWRSLKKQPFSMKTWLGFMQSLLLSRRL